MNSESVTTEPLQTRPVEHPVQILSADADSNTFNMNKEALHDVIDRIPKNIPVAILSVVGAYRSGKSFLLDFFLRYLHAVENGEDVTETFPNGVPCWMHYGGDILEGNSNSNSDPLIECKGFSYKGGSDRNTQGIWLWSKPFILSNDNVTGGRMCVLIMDTQGMFDGLSGQMLTTSIVGLGTLLASYQIFNIEKRLQEDDLQHLALFSEYSRVVFEGDDNKRLSLRLSSRQLQFALNSPIDSPAIPSENLNLSGPIKSSGMSVRMRRPVSRKAPFQQVDLLVRDWQDFNDEANISSCLTEIEAYKQKFFSPRNTKDLEETRIQIASCFKKVGMFLLPHPGKEVTRKEFNGCVDKIEVDFLRLLGFYTEKVFEEGLMPKLINNEVLFAEDFEAFCVAYGDIFRDANIFPEALTILGATAEVNSNNATRIAFNLYKATMEVFVNDKNGFVKDENFKKLHSDSIASALLEFDKRATMGSEDKIAEHRNTLVKNIEEQLKIYEKENKARDPINFLSGFFIPAIIIIIALFIKAFLGVTCSPWSSTCRTTSDFFSSLVAFIVCFVILTNFKLFRRIFGLFLSALKTLNTKEKRD